MTSPWLVLLPTDAMEVIDLAHAWGNLTCRLSLPDALPPAPRARGLIHRSSSLSMRSGTSPLSPRCRC